MERMESSQTGRDHVMSEIARKRQTSPFYFSVGGVMDLKKGHTFKLYKAVGKGSRGIQRSTRLTFPFS